MARTRINWALAEELAQQNIPYKEIAERLHTSKEYVSTYLRHKKGIYREVPFTAEEDAIILKHIKANPLNIKEACRNASLELQNRSANTIAKRWYNILSLKEENSQYLTHSINKSVCNRKVDRENIQLKVIPQTPTKREQNNLNKAFLMYNFVTTNSYNY